MNQTHLTLSWGISKGRDTFGYNIRRLRDDASGKRYNCMGGGYDMTGTVFANWLTDVYQDRLRTIANQAHVTYSAAQPGLPWTRVTNDDGLYGMSFHADKGTVHIDGACGMSSVNRIAKAIGLDVTMTCNTRSGDLTGLVITETE